MIVLTAATSQEIDGIGRCLGSKLRVASDGCTAWRSTYKNKEVLLVQTGIGRSGIKRMMKSTLTSWPTTAILSLGFGGALSPDLAVGDLIICASVIPWYETTNTPADACYADEELLKTTIKAMNGNGQKWLQGKGATVPKLASNTKEKQILRDKVQAEVCEMEDYWVAHAAEARGIPFLAVRVVYDDLNDEIPDFERMVDTRGNVDISKTTAYLLTHPKQLFHARASYRNCCRAKESLSAFVEKFLDIL
jgi:adenosylhomocysteine nucleosidase